MSYPIEAQQLTKQYRSQKENHPTIQDLNLAIRQGNVMTKMTVTEAQYFTEETQR